MGLELGQLVRALSRTIDLVGVDEVYHGRRVAFMADLCAGRLGSAPEARSRLLRAALLHDCGVSSTRVHRKLVDELDWQDSDLHCRIGAERLRSFAPLAELAEIVSYHHTRWQLLENLALDHPDKRDANLIYLVDRVDALQAQQGTIGALTGKEDIRRKIQSFRHSYFAPEVVDAFLAASAVEAFWIGMGAPFLEDQFFGEVGGAREVAVDEEHLVGMATVFAEIVDAKSAYTAEHSRGVAELAEFLGECCSLPSSVCRRLKVAGLLHDLGKLQVPDVILESPEPLAPEEQAAMRHHSYVTYAILRSIGGLEDITRWASEHHERLDGSGYPFRRAAQELSLESRIVIVADIYQAMAQNRPYRAPMPPELILDYLQGEARLGRIDGALVEVVARELPRCHERALLSVEAD